MLWGDRHSHPWIAQIRKEPSSHCPRTQQRHGKKCSYSIRSANHSSQATIQATNSKLISCHHIFYNGVAHEESPLGTYSAPTLVPQQLSFEPLNHNPPTSKRVQPKCGSCQTTSKTILFAVTSRVERCGELARG